MQELTLTIPMSDNNPKDLGYFRFSRDFEGKGNWITQSFRQGVPANCLVPTNLGQSLTTIAKEMGISEEHNFSLYPPKPEPVVSVGGGGGGGRRRKKKKKDTGIMYGFNPFNQ